MIGIFKNLDSSDFVERPISATKCLVGTSGCFLNKNCFWTVSLLRCATADVLQSQYMHGKSDERTMYHDQREIRIQVQSAKDYKLLPSWWKVTNNLKEKLFWRNIVWLQFVFYKHALTWTVTLHLWRISILKWDKISKCWNNVKNPFLETRSGVRSIDFWSRC